MRYKGIVIIARQSGTRHISRYTEKRRSWPTHFPEILSDHRRLLRELGGLGCLSAETALLITEVGPISFIELTWF